MSETIEIKGLDELIRRMKAYPGKLRDLTEEHMRAAMTTLWENVPPYPPPPDGSTYTRQGTLGRTLGSSEAGGKGGGQPSIYEVRPLGGGYEGRFGTNLSYAPYVIGDESQARHMSHWWTMKNIAAKSAEKIQGQFRQLADKLAAFLEGKGG